MKTKWLRRYQIHFFPLLLALSPCLLPLLSLTQFFMFHSLSLSLSFSVIPSFFLSVLPFFPPSIPLPLSLVSWVFYSANRGFLQKGSIVYINEPQQFH